MVEKGGRIMQKVCLGRTGLVVNKNGFGALPIQRVPMEDACRILRNAYEHEINFFDTARMYSDSEEKIGIALHAVRKEIIISSKTLATTAEEFWKDLHTSLLNLKTDYLDIYQFHNPTVMPQPGDQNGLYEAMIKAKKQGLIRYIGITNHRLQLALEAINSSLYDTIQFPFSYLATAEEINMVHLCEKENIGFICMKALAGGLITRSDVAYAFLSQYKVAPIWGIQSQQELEEFLSYNEDPPFFDDARKAFVQKEREELSGDFCRGCGYCMPCPVGIKINDCARMALMMRRSPQKFFINYEWYNEMKKIENCLHCGKCKQRCPYRLDIPALLEKNYENYKTFWGEI